jgi:hypothetical protein
MSEEKNDKWLEKIISKTINTTKPQFDAEKWKKKFPDEMQTLQSRTVKKSTNSIQKIKIFKSPIAKLAAAAVIIFVIGLFLIHPILYDNNKNINTTYEIKAPGELLTSTALLHAYLKGGMEAFDEQNRKAVQMLNRKPEEITIHELLAEDNSI